MTTNIFTYLTFEEYQSIYHRAYSVGNYGSNDRRNAIFAALLRRKIAERKAERERRLATKGDAR